MPNLFDDLQDKVFDISSEVFGYDAEWNDGENPVHMCRVLFRKPTEREMLTSVGYSDQDFILEYKEGDWPGLFERSRDGVLESVTVNSVGYSVRHIEALHDGKTYRAICYKL